ncbi:LLM class flavin-dependent oxidoreductase [Pseudonocardia phyllosphaerae]|uniref:LLM class flavin-dependent oxidoreductase n=1 Tax=Pseudonocardia phyllosphaerae TaxID=3390502 RepID=UPI00397D1498
MSAPFRFGVIAAAHGSGDAWTARARRVAELGYSTLLTPDNLPAHEPLLALATAAAAAPTLRVCPFVLAAPLRTPASVAWQATSLTALTGGRFELGLGTGRPDARDEAAALGMSWGTGAERLAAVRAAVDATRERSPATPVVLAASGPKALATAAEIADTVFLAARPTTSRDEVVAMAAVVRAAGREPEIGMNLFAVGDDVPEEMLRWAGPGAAEALADPDSLVRLRGTPTAMADELRRRRDTLGAGYFAVSEGGAEALAPVVELLSGT